jgi:hypothetical protein
MERDERRKRRPFPLLHPFLLHVYKETEKEQIYPFNVEIVKNFHEILTLLQPFPCVSVQVCMN